MQKFRLSDHFLPIERGRYLKPKLLRNERLCSLCNSNADTEIHALFQCTNDILRNINIKYRNLLSNISSQCVSLRDNIMLLYLLRATDLDTVKSVGNWLYNVNETYKKIKLK